MSETHDSTSLQGLHSVAERLRMSGFRQTSIARAVTELVGEYLGIHSNIGDNLIRALGNTNNAASVVLDSNSEAANDASILTEDKKAA
jgi:hypothetical protein